LKFIPEPSPSSFSWKPNCDVGPVTPEWDGNLMVNPAVIPDDDVDVRHCKAPHKKKRRLVWADSTW
jgi:hypothetical protein